LKLIHKATGAEVEVGDIVTDFRNDTATVVGWEIPKSPASSGRIRVAVEDVQFPASYYPSVFECEFVGRTDRA
jgi:hypothetical protein